MKVVIAGGTGFLGTSLADALADAGHDVAVPSRETSRARSPRRARRVAWQPDRTDGPWTVELAGADAVVNLSGESIAGRR